ncbi:protein croquemort-like [Ostrinia furnacalis]|uniref:protein croquemort-like n=1 Tax=Ostrinia furnacalis TaxID=93504 RepID=UPI00103F01AB|nr:protein croquemort-like [Ostrinia furnacalis]
MVSPKVKSGLFMGFGATMVVIGAVMVVYWPPIFMSQLQRMMILSEDSMSFSIWRETPIPMFLECFLFNITNVDDILAGKNVTLQVAEMGPYVFRETHLKTNLSWNDNSTITFFNERWWHFVPEMSNGSLSDNITTINPVIATVAYTLRHRNALLNMFVDGFLRLYHRNLFLTANASAWLFDGIDDPVIDIAEQFPNLPINIPFDKFGWFYTRNGSIDYDGAFNMHTGASDFSQLGNIMEWRHSNRTTFRGECGKVQGSTGELWAPELGQPEVYIFASDICTYMILSKDKEVRVQGIDGVQYAANDSVFDNGYRYPHMACYCDEVRDGNCLPPGALNVSECRYGAPAFVSLPHFLNADPYYPSKIEGLNPTSEHNFRLSLEMFTGMPLAVAAQLQVNMLVRHVGGISLNNVLPDPDTLVPMFWFRQELQTTPEYAAQARLALRLRYWVPYGLIALTVIGVILLVPGIIILFKRILRSSETRPILSESSSEESTNAAQ